MGARQASGRWLLRLDKRTRDDSDYFLLFSTPTELSTIDAGTCQWLWQEVDEEQMRLYPPRRYDDVASKVVGKVFDAALGSPGYRDRWRPAWVRDLPAGRACVIESDDPLLLKRTHYLVTQGTLWRLECHMWLWGQSAGKADCEALVDSFRLEP